MSNDFRAVTFDGSNYRSGQLPTGGNTATTGEAQSVQIRDRSTDNMRSGMTADGTTKTEAQHSGSHSTLNNDGASSTVATARSQSGTPQTAERVTQDSIVVLPNGMTVKVREAAALGFVRQNERGQWIDTTQAERDAAQQTAEQDTTPAVELTGDSVIDNTMGELIAAAPPQMLTAVLTRVAAGTVTNDDIDSLGAAVGVNGDIIRAEMPAIQEAYAKQAGKALAAMGVDGYACQEWARTNAPAMLNAAIREQLLGRRLDGWRSLAAKYLQSVDIDPAALADHRPDVQVIRSLPGGDSLVRIPGRGEVSLKTARRNGWL